MHCSGIFVLSNVYRFNIDLQHISPDIIPRTDWARNINWLNSSICDIYFFTVNFSPTCRRLWACTKFFSSCHISCWWATNTASFLDTPHTGVWHLPKKFYCRTANSKGDTVTANLLLRVSTITWRDKHWSSILDSDPLNVRTKVSSAGISHTIYFCFLLHCQNIQQAD